MTTFKSPLTEQQVNRYRILNYVTIFLKSTFLFWMVQGFFLIVHAGLIDMQFSQTAYIFFTIFALVFLLFLLAAQAKTTKAKMEYLNVYQYIKPADCEFMATMCDEYPEINAYRQKVIEQHRPFTVQEYCMLYKWYITYGERESQRLKIEQEQQQCKKLYQLP